MNYLLYSKCGDDYGCISQDGEKKCVNCSLKGVCQLKNFIKAVGTPTRITGICDRCLDKALKR